MAVNVLYYAGSSSFYPGDTSYGFYDNDPDFQYDIDKNVQWIARRLGYPVMDVEMTTHQLFDCYEEAVTQYSYLINTFESRDKILNLLGMPTGSTNLTNRYLDRSLTGIFKLAKEYGTQVGSGGTQTWYTGSISVNQNQQVYDFTEDASFEVGDPATDSFTIRRVFFEAPPSIVKYFDPYLGTGLGSQQLLEQFGWGTFSPPLNFLLMPVHYDVMRVQAIELNDQIRRSAYSFQITRNRIRIFPVPQSDYRMWFHYTLDFENVGQEGSTGRISNLSNIPFYNLEYQYINDMGRNWIRKYALALAKEILGIIRTKYDSYPVGDQSVNLNGDDLISQGREEQERLVEDLKETLDLLTAQSQLERKASEAESQANVLKYVPMKIYVK